MAKKCETFSTRPRARFLITKRVCSVVLLKLIAEKPYLSTSECAAFNF